MRRPVIYHTQILAWADAYHKRTGRWPKGYSGRIPGMLGLTWLAVDMALRKGFRGLPGRSSLARLLAERRGVRNRHRLPRFTQAKILRWADAHRRRTGKWPTHLSGPIPDARGETWLAVDKALRNGGRGLTGGRSLGRFLAAQRRIRNQTNIPMLTIKQILAWADAHHRRTGKWPTAASGPIPGAPGERWSSVNTALIDGLRRLRGGSSLARLLARERGVRNLQDLPDLVPAKILRWADAHHRRNGMWPGHLSGPIPEAPGETWGAVEAGLQRALRGLPGGSSIFRFLQQHGRIPAERRRQPRPVGR